LDFPEPLAVLTFFLPDSSFALVIIVQYVH
jgi:hypothetical protein